MRLLTTFIVALSLIASQAHATWWAKMGGPAAGGGGGGTVSFVGTAIGTDTDGTVTVTPHTSTGLGDYMIAYVLSDTAASQSITWPSGWDGIDDSGDIEVISSSSIAYVGYKIASSDESGAYNFILSQAGGEIATITTFSKSAGTWAVADSSTSSDTGTSLTSGAVDIAANGALYIGWGSDDAFLFGGTPTDMTSLGHENTYSGSIRIDDWYQLYSSLGSGVTKTNTVAGSSDLSTIAIVLEAQ